MEFHMEKVSCFIRMELIIQVTLLKEMLMGREDLSVPRGGYTKGNYRTNRLKGREYFTIRD